MTQDEKDLLLKDLSARLPYKVQASYYGSEEECETWDEIESIESSGYVDIGQYILPIEGIKPYLFPLSSMTEEQYKELHEKLIELGFQALNDEISHIEAVKFEIDYYLKNHFDYRGLIPKSLALDATGLNIY